MQSADLSSLNAQFAVASPVLIVPKWVDKKIILEVRGITLSGKFERTDKKIISKNYVKSLRTILKREFKSLFESEEMTGLISKKL